jgi:hypothetical protein
LFVGQQSPHQCLSCLDWSYSCWCSSEDQIAIVESHDLTDVTDQLWDFKDHISGVSILSNSAINLELAKVEHLGPN